MVLCTVHLFFTQTEGEAERSRLKTSESISLAEDIYKKEEQASDEIINEQDHLDVYVILHTHYQVAELTKEWAAKWKDIKRIVEVCVHISINSIE